MSDIFKRLYLCEPVQDPFYPIAMEYHDRCKAFDKTVRDDEIGMMNKNAIKVRRELCRKYGIVDHESKTALQKAIVNEARYRDEQELA